ncbi:MAG: hypothetical protein JRI68_18440 [Deltaproteobacteria bacterium]|nr:hypothetical protein [Deltaproteobacteria bacterium]
MSTTDPKKADPPDAKPGPTDSQVARKPLLASEALMEDLAPVEPWAREVRWWAASWGVLFALLGVAPYFDASAEGSPILSFILAVATLGAALAPVDYATRAVALVAIGALCGVLGVAGLGPAAVLGRTLGAWAILHLVTATGLPAALLFRARYRAYVGARYILVAALGATFPFVGYCLLMFGQDVLAIQIASGIALASIALSLLGFMGSETTIAGNWVAGVVILTVAGQIGVETMVEIWPQGLTLEIVWASGSVTAFAGACLLGAFGVFQVLAGRHWSDARDVDLRRAKPERPKLPSITDFWSTRK